MARIALLYATSTTLPSYALRLPNLQKKCNSVLEIAKALAKTNKKDLAELRLCEVLVFLINVI
jgi:hypothetical protein